MTKYGFRDNKLTTARVTTDDLQATTKVVGTSEIENAAITAAKLASNAVESAKIKDAAVTTAKIADEAVTAAKLAGWTHGSVSVDFGSVNAHQTVTKEVAVSGIKKGDPVVACFFEDPGASMAIVGAYGSQDGSITFIALETGGVTQDLGAKVVNFFAMTE